MGPRPLGSRRLTAKWGENGKKDKPRRLKKLGLEHSKTVGEKKEKTRHNRAETNSPPLVGQTRWELTNVGGGGKRKNSRRDPRSGETGANAQRKK